MRRTTIRILTVSGIAAASVAGCTSADTKNDYVDTVNGIQESALEAFNQAASSTPANKRAMVEQLEAGEAALADAVAELEGVDVPEEVEDGHPNLVAGIDDLRALFAQTASDVEKAKGTVAFSAVTALASEGQVIGTDIDRAIDRINDDLGAN